MVWRESIDAVMDRTRRLNGSTRRWCAAVAWATAAMSSAVVCGPLSAAPQGEQVVAGSADFVRQGDLTQVTVSNNAIINYSSFDIASHETVRFVQPSATARVLNRVSGSVNPTQIDGTLEANGRVYIVNPYGVYFGGQAIVDVAGIYAAAASITNEDFLSNVDQFTDATGSVVNLGRIEGDAVALIGKHVANHGTIVAEEGMVMMAAGSDVFIGDRQGHIVVKIDAASVGGEEAQDGDASGDASATSTQQVSTDTGDTAGAAGVPGVENTGVVRARRVRMGAGDIYSLAIRQTRHATVKAQEIEIDGGASGVVEVSGVLDASNPDGAGGSVEVLGDQVALIEADIDASGGGAIDADGGTVLVGGDFQGQGQTRTASHTFVGPGTTITADAGQVGDGGTVIVWADDVTGFYGDISARGGQVWGDGGFVETSGKVGLSILGGRVDTSATLGATGDWLLDPTDAVIVLPPPPADTDVLPVNFNTADVGGDQNLTIDVNSINAAIGEVVIQAERDAFVNAVIDVSAANVGLQIQAGRHIEVNHSITLAGGALTLEANSSASANGADGVGDVLMVPAVSIATSGGSVNISGVNLDLQGISTGSGAIDLAATGNITINAPMTADNQITIAAGTTGTGDVLFIDNAPLNVPANTANDGKVTTTNGTDTAGLAADQNNITITAGDPADAANSDGSINLIDGAVNANSADAATDPARVNLTAVGGSINSNNDDGTAEVTAAGELTLQAPQIVETDAVTPGNHLDVTGVTSLTVIDTGSGEIQIDEEGGNTITSTSIQVEGLGFDAIDIVYDDGDVVDIDGLTITKVDLTRGAHDFSFTAGTTASPLGMDDNITVAVTGIELASETDPDLTMTLLGQGAIRLNRRAIDGGRNSTGTLTLNAVNGSIEVIEDPTSKNDINVRFGSLADAPAGAIVLNAATIGTTYNLAGDLVPGGGLGIAGASELTVTDTGPGLIAIREITDEGTPDLEAVTLNVNGTGLGTIEIFLVVDFIANRGVDGTLVSVADNLVLATMDLTPLVNAVFTFNGTGGPITQSGPMTNDGSVAIRSLDDQDISVNHSSNALSGEVVFETGGSVSFNNGMTPVVFGTVTIEDTNGNPVDHTTTVGENLAVTTGGVDAMDVSISDEASVTVTGTTSLTTTATDGAIVLDHLDSQYTGSLSADTQDGAITVVVASPIILGDVSIGGNATFESRGSNASITNVDAGSNVGPLTIIGDTTFETWQDGDGGPITIDGSGSSFGLVNARTLDGAGGSPVGSGITGNAITISENADMTLGDIQTTGTARFEAAGSINGTQTVLAETLEIDADTGIQGFPGGPFLADVGTLSVDVSGGNATISNAQALNLSTSTVSGTLMVDNDGPVDITGTINNTDTLNVEANGAVDITGTVSTNTLTLEATGGPISDGSGAQVTVTGAATLTTRQNGGAAITLDEPNSSYGSVTARTLDNSGNNRVGTAGTDAIVILGNGPMDLAGVETAGDALFVSSGAGAAITDSGEMTIDGEAAFLTELNSGGPITIDGDGNALDHRFGSVSVGSFDDAGFAGGSGAAAPGAIQVVEDDAMVIANVVTRGNAVFTSRDGGITQSSTGGSPRFEIGDNPLNDTVTFTSNGTNQDLVLNNTANTFRAAVIFSHGSGGSLGKVTLENTVASDIGLTVSSPVGGDLSVNHNGGALTVNTSAVEVDGSVSMVSSGDLVIDQALSSTGGNAVTLNSTGGSISGAGTVTGGALDLDVSAGIMLTLDADSVDAAGSTSGGIDLTDTGTSTTAVSSLSTVGGAITFNKTGAGNLNVNGDVTSGSASGTGGDINILANGDITVATGVRIDSGSTLGSGFNGGNIAVTSVDGDLNVNENAVFSTLDGIGGVLSPPDPSDPQNLGLGVDDTVTFDVGTGDITLSALPENIIIANPFTVDAVLEAPGDVIIQAPVTFTGTAAIIRADFNPLAPTASDGVGGVIIEDGGVINAPGTVTILGSDLSTTAGGVPDAVVLEGSGVDRIAAGGAVSLEIHPGTSVTDTAVLQLGGNVTGTGFDFMGPVQLVGNAMVNSGSGAVMFTDTVVALASQDLTVATTGDTIFSATVGQGSASNALGTLTTDAGGGYTAGGQRRCR